MKASQKRREEYRTLKKGYYHFCTDGLKGGLIFNNARQFAFGMFLMGLISILYGVRIYAFTLMPNHIHIILSGTGIDCLKAFDYLKRKLSLRLVKDGYSPLPEDYWFKLVPIESEGQMRSEIVYVLRNCLEKGLGVVGGYLWSSAWLYHSDVSKLVDGILAGQISCRQRRRLLLGQDALPEEWVVNPYIGLHPGSFVDTSLVMRLFPEPKDLQTALVKDYEVMFQIAGRLGELQEFNKSEIEGIVSHVLQKRFSGRELSQLSEEDRGKMVIILSRDYGLNSYQISKSIYIKEKTVRQLLASKELR
ncbi:MAG: hypothetical protein IK113_03220 [Bacteroidales bacterium]|nr:hypothetical protein [Bacteroidales bacterium]